MGRTRLAFSSDSKNCKLPPSRVNPDGSDSDFRVQGRVVCWQRRLVALPVVGVVTEWCFALNFFRLDMAKTAPAARPAGIRDAAAPLGIGVESIPLLVGHRRVNWLRVARRRFLLAVVVVAILIGHLSDPTATDPTA